MIKYRIWKGRELKGEHTTKSIRKFRQVKNHYEAPWYGPEWFVERITP